MLSSFLFFIFIIIVNFIIFYFYKPVVKIYNLYDQPDFKRKLHKKKIPLLGGLFLILNLLFIIVINFFYPKILEGNYFNNIKSYFTFFFISILFYLLGFLDDKFKLSANVKLTVMVLFLFSALFLDQNILLRDLNFNYLNYTLNLSGYSYFLTVFCFLLFINAFNMLDGINGQASAYFIFIMLIFLSKAVLIYFVFIFLVYALFFINLNLKNKTFLGDSGSLPLAFIIAYIFIKSYNIDHKFSVEEIFLVMSLPGYELLRLAITRILKKKHPFKADNLHLHHLIFIKKGFMKTFFIIQFLLIFPYVLLHLSNNFLFTFFLNLIMYVIVVIYFNKFTAKKN